MYRIALGDDFDRLRPELRAYFLGTSIPGDYGIGEGVFEYGGSHKGWLSWLARPVLGAGIFLPAARHDVPFHIENRPEWDGNGWPALRAVRVFDFPQGASTFEDVSEVTPDGVLVDRLGVKRRYEILLRCEVSERGGMLMTSIGGFLRLGRLRIPVPKLLGVSLRGEDYWDDRTGLQRVDVRGWNPLLGTLIEYRGWFRYRYRSQRGSFPER